jgi:3-carboxy-cis,cis-muconate cycloisomerase
MSDPTVISRMLRSLATTEALEEIFADASYLAAMLQVEVALAKAQVRVGLAPPDAALAIERAAGVDGFDRDALAQAARRSGTLAVPLVETLKARVLRDAPAALPFLHRGATSQDVTDTALVLCLARAWPVLAHDHEQLLASLRHTSDRHAGTLMLARTLLQPAAPTTFGLKVAGWFGAVSRAGARMRDGFRGATVLQFGGAAGTLAALGREGPAIADVVADELGLPLPDAPWHVHRDRLATLVTACGVYVGILGKIARDISLLMQFEVGEVAEPGGSSSAMPHKRNPAACAVALAAATRVPGLVAAYLAAMPQEHERGVGNWHAEGPILADVVQTTGAALGAMREAVEGLQVNSAQMRTNIAATRGLIFAEQAMTLLGPVIGATAARQAIETAMDDVREHGTDFVAALLSNALVRTSLRREDLAALGNAEQYLGSAEFFRRRLLDSEPGR